jgi:hypothetical protein
MSPLVLRHIPLSLLNQQLKYHSIYRAFEYQFMVLKFITKLRMHHITSYI